MKIHDGIWAEKDVINPLNSLDQWLGQKTSYLGLDTEMIVKKDNEVIWPWDAKLPQERDIKDPYTGDGYGQFDFHGDGFATELCVQPTYCLDLMMEHIGRGLRWEARQYNRPVSLSAPAVYDVPSSVFDAAPEDAKKLGCMPSINVYGDSGEPASLPNTKRTTGCHLHISHPALQDPDIAIALVKWADVLVGCTWTYISPNPSKAEAERRKAYGRAGEYRSKLYATITDDYSTGVEYRVLPGTPLQHPAYLTLMFSLYRSALRLAATVGEPKDDLSKLAQNAINAADRTQAKNVIRSMPIADGGRKLIRFLRRVPVKTKDLIDWANLAAEYKGHNKLYKSQNIINRNLSL